MNCFGLSTTWFKKRRAVRNPISDHVRVDDDPPDLILVHNRLIDHPLVNETLQDFILDDNDILDSPAVENPDHIGVNDDPLPDLTLVHDPLVDQPLVNETLQDLTLVVDNHNLDSPAVDDPLPDLTIVENPIPLFDSEAVDNPILDNPEVNHDLILVHTPLPDDLRTDDYPLPENSLVYHPSIDNPVSRFVLPAVCNSIIVKNLLDLPNHIIIDILIRLPPKCVFRCQRASKLFEILAKNPFFIRTHLAKATSIIALQSFSQSSDRDIKFYFMDEQAKKVKESKLKLDFCYTQKEYPLMLYDSYDGFVLLKNNDSSWRSIFVIWNPTTAEQVTITMEGLYSKVCGFYFNPHNKEYEVLLIYWEDGGSGRYAFDILSFGSKLRRNIGRYAYMPRSERPPMIINGTLYWMVDKIYGDAKVNCSNSIMTFEIATNKLSTMQHGGAPCEAGYNFGIIGYKHDYMHLIEIEEQVGLCVLLSYTELVLWALNAATKSWDKAYVVTLPGYSMPRYFSCWPNKLDVEVVNIMNGKLLVRQKNRLLHWDLELNTHKILEKKGFENDSFRLVIHTPSAVSLDTDKLIELYR